MSKQYVKLMQIAYDQCWTDYNQRKLLHYQDNNPGMLPSSPTIEQIINVFEQLKSAIS